MRVIILGPREPIPPVKGGAIEKLTWELAKFLSKNNIETYVLATTTNEENIGRFIEIDGVIVHYVTPPIPGGSLFYFTKMPIFSSRAYTFVNKLCQRECVVHSVYFYNTIKGDYRSTPLVITEFEHYPWIREYLYHYPFISTYARLRWEIDALLRIQLAKLLMPRAKLLTSVSKLQKKILCCHIPNICDRIIKVPNFVNTEFYKPTYSKDLREKLRDGAEIVAGFVGRLTPHKGLHVLLYSLSKMDKRLLKKLKLIVIGPRAPGFHIQYAKDLYAKYVYSIVSWKELSSVVRFIGQVDESEMPKYLSAIDILIHPSFVEAFGLVLIEAMAVGTPVVAFDIPPMNEIVTSDVGFLVKPHTHELTKTLEYIVENKDEIYRRKETARGYVERNYSLKRIGLIFKNIYENLVE